MFNSHKLKLLYLLIAAVLAALLGLSWIYEEALVNADLHSLATQAELTSIRFDQEISRHEFRSVSDAFGAEQPNLRVEIADGNGRILFRSRDNASTGRCASSSLSANGFRLRLCRVDGPLVSMQQQLRDRAKTLMAAAVLIIAAAIYLFGRIVRKSILGSLNQISAAMGDTPIDAGAPLDSLLNRLSKQERRIEEFEQTVSADARFNAIGAVAAQFQHDVGGPLSVVQTSLNDEKTDPELRDAAREAAGRIRSMLDGIGGFSKTLQMRPARIDVAEVLEAVRWEALAGKPERRIEITSEKPEDGLFARADAVGLIRVVTNALNNAFEANSERALLVARHNKDGNTIELEVSDWGTGLSPEIREKILRPFASFGKDHGTGLGLWHGSQMTTAMNGTLTVHSPGFDGAATTVRIAIPAAT